jgi:hypothetical protein
MPTSKDPSAFVNLTFVLSAGYIRVRAIGPARAVTLQLQSLGE